MRPVNEKTLGSGAVPCSGAVTDSFRRRSKREVAAALFKWKIDTGTLWKLAGSFVDSGVVMEVCSVSIGEKRGR